MLKMDHPRWCITGFWSVLNHQNALKLSRVYGNNYEIVLKIGKLISLLNLLKSDHFQSLEDIILFAIGLQISDIVLIHCVGILNILSI